MVSSRNCFPNDDEWKAAICLKMCVGAEAYEGSKRQATVTAARTAGDS